MDEVGDEEGELVGDESRDEAEEDEDGEEVSRSEGRARIGWAGRKKGTILISRRDQLRKLREVNSRVKLEDRSFSIHGGKNPPSDGESSSLDSQKEAH